MRLPAHSPRDKQSRKSIDRLAVVDISAGLVRLFLADLEVSPRQRYPHPQPAPSCYSRPSKIRLQTRPDPYRAIPFKKAVQVVAPYLE